MLDVNDNAPIFLQNQYIESRSRSGQSAGQSPDYNYGLTNIFGQYGQSGNYPSNFFPGKYVTTISEQTPVESSVMSVRAVDPDQGVSGKITYSIAEETTWLFRIDNLTGVITTAG